MRSHNLTRLRQARTGTVVVHRRGCVSIPALFHASNARREHMRVVPRPN